MCLAQNVYHLLRLTANAATSGWHDWRNTMAENKTPVNMELLEATLNVIR